MLETDDGTVVSRRGLLRLAGATGLTIVATGAVVSATGAPAAATPQAGWRYCRNCHELWFHGSSNTGWCPSQWDGGHVDVGSSQYKVKWAPTGAGQTGWLWCSSCYALFYPGVGVAARCIGTAYSHDGTGSGTYKLENTGTNGSDGPGGQNGWRCCLECGCLWHEPSSGAGYCYVNQAGGHTYSPNWYDYILRT